MKTQATGARSKKPWSTPTIEVLSYGSVEGGAQTVFREGGPVGGSKYAVNTPKGVGLGPAPKAVWSQYQHS